MADIGQKYAISIKRAEETKDIKLKVATAQKAEIENIIIALDTQVKKHKEVDIPRLEAEILRKKQDLQHTIEQINLLNRSIDV